MAVPDRAVSQLKFIPFGHLIGEPMKAAIEAQSIAAETTTKFIRSVGLEEDGKTLANVTFKYKVVNDGEESISELSVPTLTIVPIPFIRIDEMTIDFTANISQSETKETEAEKEERKKKEHNFNASVRAGWGALSASVGYGFKASCSSTHKSSQKQGSKYNAEYTMNVYLRAVQDEMPTGMTKMLNLLEELIKPKELGGGAQSPATGGNKASGK